MRREDDGRIALGDEVDLGELPDPLGILYHAIQHGQIVISWTSNRIWVYSLEGGAIALKKMLDIPDIVDIRIVGEDLIAIFTDVRNIDLGSSSLITLSIGSMSIFQPFYANKTIRNQGFLQWNPRRLQCVCSRLVADYGAHGGIGCPPLMSCHSIASEGAKVVVRISATLRMDISIQRALPQRDGGSSIASFWRK